MQPATNRQRYRNAATALTAAYLIAVFLGLPLVFSDYYFNITETKHVFFLISSGVYLLSLLLLRISFPPDYGVAAPRAALHPAALAICAFFAVSVVGGLISRYPGEVFWGENNRYQGLLTICVYALAVLSLSQQTVDLRWPERALVLGAALAGLLGLINHFGVDPFGFYENLRQADRGRFLSTLGNANFYGSYLSLAFCVTLGWFLRAPLPRARVLPALALASASFGALVSGSDSVALALFAAAAVFPMLSFSDPAALRRLPLGWGIFFLCSFIFGLFSRWLPSATYLSGFTTLISRAVVSLPLAALMLLLWLGLRRSKPERLVLMKKPYVIALASAFALGVFALVLFNTALSGLPLGGLERYARFSESWGTDRGKIWMFVSQFYASLPPVQKLFGAGSGALFHADALRPLFPDASLDTAHSEYLQYLVTNGALGLACYLAALVLAVRTGVRRSVSSPVFRGLAAAVVAYAVQSAVNIAQPASTPVFFVLLGVLISRAPEPPGDITG